VAAPRRSAICRCGELLRQIEASKGGRPAETRDGTVPSLTRTSAARDAGMSDRQRVTAVRVAPLGHQPEAVAVHPREGGQTVTHE
jgi:hypothetical protein